MKTCYAYCINYYLLPLINMHFFFLFSHLLLTSLSPLCLALPLPFLYLQLNSSLFIYSSTFSQFTSIYPVHISTKIVADGTCSTLLSGSKHNREFDVDYNDSYVVLKNVLATEAR